MFARGGVGVRGRHVKNGTAANLADRYVPSHELTISDATPRRDGRLNLILTTALLQPAARLRAQPCGRRCACPSSPTRVADAFAKVDSDDGKIDRWNSRRQAAGRLGRGFGACCVDVNDDGVLDLSEFRPTSRSRSLTAARCRAASSADCHVSVATLPNLASSRRASRRSTRFHSRSRASSSTAHLLLSLRSRLLSASRSARRAVAPTRRGR